MNDYLAPTAALAVPYCPGCDPERGLGTEILEPRYCPAHALTTRGADDAATSFTGGPREPTRAEAGGDTNARFCALLHRQQQLPAGTIPEAPPALAGAWDGGG